MKIQTYTVVLLVNLLIFVFSCTKKAVEPTDQLTGTWKLTQKKIIKGNVITEIPLSNSLQTLTFSKINQLRATIDGDTILNSSSYYRIGNSDIIGQYLEVKKTSTDAIARTYIFTNNIIEGTLYLTSFNNTSSTNYKLQRQ